MDFSPNAETALYFAMGLARRHGCMLILLNAVETMPQENPPSEETLRQQEIEKKKAMERLRSISVQIDYAGGIKYECVVETGNDVVECIVNTAKKGNTDLIVMGTKGERGTPEFVFGTITSGVIEDTLCPVLVIPEGVRLDKTIKRITFTTNFLQSDLDALKMVTLLASAWDAELNVVHVNDQVDTGIEPEQEVEKFGLFIRIAESELNYERISFELLSGETEPRLLDYVKSDKTDLLILSTKHRNYFGRLFDKSLTLDLARLTDIPLLVFHHRKEKPVAGLRRIY